MKKFLLLILLPLIVSCSTAKKSSSLAQEEQFVISRRYIGNFIGYSHTGAHIVGGKDLIWIKTTVYNTFGKISAYGRTCDFNVGDKIYLKPTNVTQWKFDDWEYQIENDSSVNYKVSEFRFENNVFTRSRSL
jgi:hypothetical protein